MEYFRISASELAGWSREDRVKLAVELGIGVKEWPDEELNVRILAKAVAMEGA